MKIEITDCGRDIKGERQDCTVRAVAAAMALPYGDAHARLSMWRKPRKGFDFRLCGESLGLIIRPELSCRRLESILPEIQQGRFIVRLARHVFAVVDGVIIDLFAPNPSKMVRMVYEANP